MVKYNSFHKNIVISVMIIKYNFILYSIIVAIIIIMIIKNISIMML